MASALGIISITGNQDKEGQRTYDVDWLVQSLVSDGPVDIMFASGLSVIGTPFTLGNTNDPWAFCTPELKVSRFDSPNEPGIFWRVGQRFSTVPLRRCQSSSIENPLNEPYKISGSFVKYTKEATLDKNGKPIRNSAFEVIRGKSVERDFNRPTVSIERNVLLNPLTTYAALVDHVNDSTLWGLSARKVKLSNVSWTRKLYGVCTFYYTVKYDFDIDWNTFDRVVIDEGTRVLQGHSPGSSLPELDPDERNPLTNKKYSETPEAFEAYKDVNGNNAKVILDGKGRPWDGEGNPGQRVNKLYPEANLMLLGLPSVL